MPESKPGKPPLPSTTRRVVTKGPQTQAARAGTPPPAPAPPKKAPASTVMKKSDRTGKAPAVPQGEVEVVVSNEGQEATHVRQRVRGEAHMERGLGLRQKIMIAMASVTIITAILIFIVVYVKAVQQLSDEIDSKGVAQTRLMASMGPEIWLGAMYKDPGFRFERLTNLIHYYDESWTMDSGQRFLRDNPDLFKEHEGLYKGGAGQALAMQAEAFFARLLDKRKAALPREDERRALQTRFDNALKDERWKRDRNALFDPFGSMRPLRADDGKVLESKEVVQLSVLDITTKEGGSASVVADPAVEGYDKIHNQRPNVNGLRMIEDGFVKGAGTPVRSFKLEMEHELPTGKVKMRYFVLLSLRQIEQAQSTLRTIIFLPILLAVLVGLAIAWWISERISEPVRVLMDDINAVSGGDLDHETVPHSSDEIGQLATTFNRMTQALKAAHNQELEAKALEHELNIAAEIQANLVPKKMLKLPGYDISAYYRPSKEVGGDYYDFIEIDETHCGIIVADVSGKGVPGSLVMSMARAFIRMEAERTRNTSPSDSLKKANKMLAADIKKGMFVTAMYAILDKTTNELAISSAGHNPMVLWRAASNEIQLVNPKGIALGFDKGPVFERTISEEKVQLQPGDRFVMYTDGTVEAMNEKNEEYGDDKFNRLIQQLATRDSNQLLNIVVKSLDDHKGSAPQHDDMTIVTVRYTGGGQG